VSGGRGVTEARERVIDAVLRLVSSERAGPSSSYEAEIELCHDMIEEAARALVAAAEEPPEWQSMGFRHREVDGVVEYLHDGEWHRCNMPDACRAYHQ
jgi:hypothetical protein